MSEPDKYLLSSYLFQIRDRIIVNFPSVSGLTPIIEMQTFNHISISYNSNFENGNPFFVLMNGKWINSSECLELSKELDEASLIINNLNHLLKITSMNNESKLREKEFKIYCFLRNITDESEREETRVNKFELYKDSGSWLELMNLVNKIETESNDTVKIEGTTIEIYGSIDTPIVISNIEMNKKQALFEALFQYVQKRW